MAPSISALNQTALEQELDQLIEAYIEVEQELSSAPPELQRVLQPVRNRLHRARDRTALNFQRLKARIHHDLTGMRAEMIKSIAEFNRALHEARTGLKVGQFTPIAVPV